METGFVKMATSTYLYFIRINYILLRRDTLNQLCVSKERQPFPKKITNTNNIEKRQKPFFNTNDFPSSPSKPNTNTNKQDYSRTMNASPRNYNTHSTSLTTETYLLQSQPNTKEILPTKRIERTKSKKLQSKKFQVTQLQESVESQFELTSPSQRTTGQEKNIFQDNFLLFLDVLHPLLFLQQKLSITFSSIGFQTMSLKCTTRYSIFLISCITSVKPSQI